YGAMAGAASGFVGGAGNAWVRGASSSEIFRQGFRGAGWGAATGAVAGGIGGGIKAKRMGLKIGTGTGTSVISKMEGSVSSITGEGEKVNIDLTSAKEFTKYTHETFPGSEDYVTMTSQMTKEGTLGYSLHPSGGYMIDPDGARSLGMSYMSRETIFGQPDYFIKICPTITTVADMQAVLGHEVIHTYHFSLGMGGSIVPYSRNTGTSEYYAYRYSAAIPHSFQKEAIQMMKSYQSYALPFISLSDVYPPWALPFVR
ncbi:MAG: hypothetical protein FWG84_06905, partial [Bacteroidales bacterium]|nr:hypothetical protein [Bacteroidales bacterium]